jgi:hypothetical protein
MGFALNVTPRNDLMRGGSLANSKRRCKRCGEYFEAISGLKLPTGFFCSKDHAIEYGLEESRKRTDRLLDKAARVQAANAKIAAKRERESTARRKKELNRSHHLDQLQKLVNQWVVHVRDEDKPCCTCGTTNQFIKYDCGHLRTRGASPATRFLLSNMNRQCVRCNMYESGRVAEHKGYVVATYGQETLDFIYGPHPTLKEQLPDADAIDVEIARYRKMLREAGLKPNA